MKDYHVEEDADGDDIEYSATCKLNAYSQGWKYFCLLIPVCDVVGPGLESNPEEWAKVIDFSIIVEGSPFDKGPFIDIN